MNELYIISGMTSAIITLCVYIRLLHVGQIRTLKDCAKEHSERTAQVTEAVTSMKGSVDSLVKTNDKIFDHIISSGK